MAPPNPVPYSIYLLYWLIKKTLEVRWWWWWWWWWTLLVKLRECWDGAWQSTGMWSPGRKMEACRILLPWERTKKWPKEDTEHEIQTSDKLIWWCFRVLRASPAAAAATTTTRGVSHCGLPIYIKKSIKANEELWKTQIFHHPKIYLIFKKSSKRNQNSFKILL